MDSVVPPAMTGEEFLARTSRSGLVSAAKLSAFALEALTLPPAHDIAARLVEKGLLTPFQAHEILRGRELGLIVSGKYHLLSLLGKGGMGRVYLATHVRMRRLVALKMLPEDQLRIPGVLERFEREARAVASLNHPNIVKAYDIDQDNEVPVLVMEYVDGRNLEEVLDAHGPFSIELAVHAVRQAAAGLQYAFDTAGLIHRDIKPGNLLLERTGTVKILDLGLARFLYDTSDQLSLHYDAPALMGTVDYLSPEQAENSHNVDTRADIYSLGGTLYTLLTGRRPLGEGSVTQKLLWAHTRDPEPVRSVRPEVPAGLAEVIQRMLAKDRARRYSRPADVVEALAPWTPPSPGPPPAEWMPPPVSGVAGAGAPAGAATLDVAGPPPANPPAETIPLRRGPTEKGPGLARALAWWLVPTGALIVALAAGLWWLLGGPSEQAPHRPPTVLLVDNSGAPGTYRTVREALADAIKRDKVLVTSPELREAIEVGPGLPCGGDVTIEGRVPVGKDRYGPVRLLPPPGHKEGEPLLKAHGVPGARVVGLALDGGGKLDCLVRVSGLCPGLRLEKMSFKGFTRAAVIATDLVGNPDAMEFKELHVSGGGPGSAGVRLEPRAGVCRNLKITDSRFDGPGAAALLVAGECADIEFRRNRAFGLEAAVRFEPGPKGAPSHLKVENCTAFQTRALLVFERPPDTRAYGKWVVERNLLIQVRNQVLLGASHPAEAGYLITAHNVADNLGPGANVLGCVEISAEDVDRHRENDRTFLRYLPGSPLMKAANGKPVGAPPPDND